MRNMNGENISVTPASLLNQTDHVPYHFIVYAVVIVMLDMVSFGIMMKAPKIASNIRFMCSNILFYDVCFSIAYVLHNILMDSPTWFYYRAVRFTVLGQWLSVTSFSVERLIALYAPFLYRRYCTVRFIKSFILAEFVCYAVILALISAVEWSPETAIRVCWGGISLHTTLSVVCIVCSLKTLTIFRQSLLQTRILAPGISSDIRKLNRSKATISLFCILFVILHVPTGFEHIIRKCEFSPTERTYSSYLIMISNGLSPFLYVWKFRECRLQGLNCLSRIPCLGFLKSTVEARRIEIFNIPIAEHMKDQCRIGKQSSCLSSKERIELPDLVAATDIPA